MTLKPRNPLKFDYCLSSTHLYSEQCVLKRERDTEREKGLWWLCCLHGAWLGIVGSKCDVSWPVLWPDFPPGQQEGP